MGNQRAVTIRKFPFNSMLAAEVCHQRPETKLVIRADQTLVLVWPSGYQVQFRRSAG